MTDFPDDDFAEEEPQSKTQIKKQMHELQALGTALLELSDKHLSKFPLSANLIAALEEAKRIKRREALRRHKQFIGKVMRDEPEIDTIRQLLSDLQNSKSTHTRQFKDLEDLRESLISGGKEALGQVIEKNPHMDRQKLRQLVSKAKKEHERNQANVAQDIKTLENKASRELFRFLRESTLGGDADNE